MKVVWSPMARTKTQEILEFISVDNPDAALTLINEFETKIQKLKENPESGRVLLETKNDNIREIVVHKNYGVIYETNSDTIEILTIRHFRQNFSASKL